MGNIAQAVGADLGGNATVDIADPIWTAIDEAGVALQQGSAGSDAFPRLLRRGDAPDGDEGELAADTLIETAQHLQRALGYRGTRYATGPHFRYLGRRGLEPLAGNAG